MNCFNHSGVVACGVCANCGRAICKECLHPNLSEKVLCSAKCSEQAELSEKSVMLTLKKAKDGAHVSAWYMFGTGAIFLICGVFMTYRGWYGPSLYFLLFGAAGIVGGVGFLRVAKRNA